MNWLMNGLKLVPLIVAAVGAVEKLATGLKGKQKQDAAVELIAELVPIIEAGIDRDVVDDAAVQDAVRKVIDAVVSLQNVTKDVLAKRAAVTPAA